MIREVKFESQDRRIKQILAALMILIKLVKKLSLSASKMLNGHTL